jgi:hypothetical protein
MLAIKQVMLHPRPPMGAAVRIMMALSAKAAHSASAAPRTVGVAALLVIADPGAWAVIVPKAATQRMAPVAQPLEILIAETGRKALAARLLATAATRRHTVVK